METTRAQQRLLDAAVDAFAEQGYGGASTREIAERAGRSPAALYVHYPSKEALLHAISLWGHADALECLSRAFAAHDAPAARLHHMVTAFSEWHMANARLARVVQYELHALDHDHRAAVVDLRRRSHGVMVRALEDGIRAGSFEVADLDGTARAVLSLCIDLVRWYTPAPGRDRASVARLNADLSLRIVHAPVPTEGTHR